MSRFAVAALLLSVAAPTGLAAQSSQSATSVTPPAEAEQAFAKKRSLKVLEAQVLLDRARFSPGVIDGLMGGNSRRAIEAYQRAKGLQVTGRADAALLNHLRQSHPAPVFSRYRISKDDVDGPFVDVPSTMEGQAKLDVLAHENPLELLAEKFHMDQEFLRALNPGTDFAEAGTEIVVVDTGEPGLAGEVARIEVDKSRESVRALAADGTLLARYPATIGSSTFPSPSGSMEVLAVAPNAKYYFSPEGRDWGPDEQLTIAAGPNNPVGTTWIDLSKEGYGIHGSPDPNLIGKTASHGCVRLTNWDVQELAEAVKKGAKVTFV